MGYHFLLHGTFLTQGSNPSLLHRKQIATSKLQTLLLNLISRSFNRAISVPFGNVDTDELCSSKEKGVSAPDGNSDSLAIGNDFQAEVVLNIGDLKPEEIGVELLFATTDNKGKLHIQERYEFTPSEAADGRAKYVASINPDRSGLYQVAGRIYAKNADLPHRQDFELVRWL